MGTGLHSRPGACDAQGLFSCQSGWSVLPMPCRVLLPSRSGLREVPSPAAGGAPGLGRRWHLPWQAA